MDTYEFNMLQAYRYNLPIPPGLMDQRRVTAKILNVRTGPGVTYKILRTLPFGSVVNVIKEENEWARIGIVEYVFAGFLEKIGKY